MSPIFEWNGEGAESEVRELTKHLTPTEFVRVVRMGLPAYRHVRDLIEQLEVENDDLKAERYDRPTKSIRAVSLSTGVQKERNQRGGNETD